MDVTGIGHALESHNLVAGSNDAQANAEALKDYRAGTLIFYAVAAASAAGSAWLYLDEYMSLLEPEPETSIQLVPTEGGAMLNLQMPLLGD